MFYNWANAHLNDNRLPLKNQPKEAENMPVTKQILDQTT